jgi:peptide/nickel transport system substrate-binding protein
MNLVKVFGLLIALLVTLVGCAAPAAPRSGPETGVAPAPAAPKRITLAFAGNPPGLANRLAAGGSGGTGVASLEALLNRGATTKNAQGQLVPQLAQSVPTVENGLWKVLPDGKMETTLKLRPDAKWHDGTPFTSADLLFSSTVDRDKDLPLAPDQGYKSVSTITAPDPQTIVVTWSAPYIHADQLFSDAPLPRHLLEQTYLESKGTLLQQPFFGPEYVGTGPYKLKTFEQGSHVIVEANDAFVLGRPKIDEIEVRFIPDLNTLLANILAGSVDMTFAGATPSTDQAIQARDQWRSGRVEINVTGWIVGFPQLLTPSPALVGEARFRQALMHGMDRQAMADSIQGGLAPVAHTNIGPNEPEYKDIEPSIVKYEFDTRKATQLLEGMGLVKGADGLYHNAQGLPISLEVRSTGTYDAAVKGMIAVADYWQKLGFNIDQVPVPQQRQSDTEYRANFTGFHVQRQPTDADSLVRYTSSQVPTAQNGYRGESKNRYVNKDLDALIDTYFLTIPRPERMGVLSKIVQHMTSEVIALGLFYDSTPRLISNRLLNVPADAPQANVYEWDVK